MFLEIFKRGCPTLATLGWVLIATGAHAQQAPTVLFHREGETEQTQPQQKKESPEVINLSEADRNALTFTAYDLDLHLNTETSHLAVHARISVRNDGDTTLSRLPLQVTSTMQWEPVRLVADGKLTPLPVAQHQLKTDVDHTGAVTEAVVTLPQPLAPGASADLDLLYSGKIEQTAGKESSSAVNAVEWDRISPEFTGFRGFGSVLWYPVAAPPAFLGDGNKLYDLVGRVRLRQMSARVTARLTVEYLGEAPKLAFLCGHQQYLDAHSENPNQPSSAAPGIATATFAPFELGFHPLSLFLSTGDANALAGGYLSFVTEDREQAEPMIAPALKVLPFMTQWLGAKPNQPLTVLQSEMGPFESGPFVVTSLPRKNAAENEEILSHVFTHAYTGNQPPWLDEGVAQFMSLLWTERTAGRDAALSQLQSFLPSLALVEPDATQPNAPLGEPLISAHSEIYYRTKAAMVLWMLRSIAGDEPLQQALQGLRSQKNPDAQTFQQLLERTSQKELSWFFDDWIYYDRGLPDLSIVSVTPRLLDREQGRGYLISVEVSNAGGAAAEVPVTIRSGSLNITERLRIPARSRATTRIVFNDTPQEVIVNDGTTPEQRTTTHSLNVNLKAPQ